MNNLNKIGFIGAGNMATAIINGMLSNNVTTAENIFVFDLDTEKLNQMSQKGIITCTSANEVVDNCHFVVLAVKPQNYQEVLTGIKNSVKDSTIMVSIAAGISINYVLSTLEKNCGCVRVMPNTPLLLGCGATAVCPSENISDEDFAVVKSMFATSGVCQVLPESQMNTIIAVNGSSPAYVYLFAKAMCDYASEQGINTDVAMELICATLKGSAEMLMKSGDTPDQLIKKVSSPGGTTLAALDVLDKGGFYDNIKNAMTACTNRAEELGK
ncbi:MAG: pyrroline-5-carboxylate reductase [Acutalibacteraceae bacterium]|nr:pyrroline-5-carboxylate reductase [Acutalibacteraceae bacterium]